MGDGHEYDPVVDALEELFRAARQHHREWGALFTVSGETHLRLARAIDRADAALSRGEA